MWVWNIKLYQQALDRYDETKLDYIVKGKHTETRSHRLVSDQTSSAAPTIVQEHVVEDLGLYSQWKTCRCPRRPS
jgi:hypothetical protein